MRLLTPVFLIALILILSITFPSSLDAYDNVVVFFDDFSDGLTDGWELLQGEWSESDGVFCQTACGS